MLVIVLLHIRFRNAHVAINFLANHALREQLVLERQLEIFKAFTRLLANPVMELIRVRQTTGFLNVGHAPVHISVHVDGKILPLLHQQQLVDLIAQGVRSRFIHGDFQRRPRGPLLLKLRLDDASLLLQFPPCDDLAVHFGDNLFHDAGLNFRAVCGGCRRSQDRRRSSGQKTEGQSTRETELSRHMQLL